MNHRKTRGLKQTRHGVGGRRTALLLRLGLYTPPSSRTASSGRFVGGRPQTPARFLLPPTHNREPYDTRIVLPPPLTTESPTTHYCTVHNIMFL